MSARLIGVLAIAIASSAWGPQSRDSAPAAPATGSISGTVLVDGAAKQPARRVRVTLTNLTGATPGQTTTTDDSGAFAFAGVPDGRFEIQAHKNGYLKGSYGASRPNRPATPIVVANGATIANLTMTIARGGVIAGVVRDPRGRPLPGLNVRVLKFGYNALSGERTLGAQSAASSATTDDRGEYRAFGLPPGSYVVLVSPPPGRSGGPGVDDIRQLSSTDVQRALQAAKSGATAPTSSTAATAASAGMRVNYAPIFHPGVTDIGAAPAIALGLSEERTGVDVAVQLVPSATISGRITSPMGPLPMLTISVVPAGANAELLAGAGVRGLSTQPRADGSYVIAGVPPGAYTVKAIFGRGRGAQPDLAAVWAAADVNVTGLDLDVPLTLQPGIPITGRVVFDGATRPTPAELQTLSFRLMPPGSGGGLLYAPGAGRVDADGRFSFAGVPPDTYQFAMIWESPGAGDKWIVKASVANGRDAFEAPLRVLPNSPVDWTITFTDTPTSLTGVLQDRGGRAATDYYVLVFSGDRQYWTPGSRRVRMTRPGTDGAFTTKGLPAGEYLVAALTDLEPGEWNDPALLEQLVASAVRVTLRDGQVTTQNFRIGG